MTKKGSRPPRLTGKQLAAQIKATSPVGISDGATSPLPPVEKISVTIHIGSHSCTVAYYNANDQKASIVSNPDGFYATPTTITPIETDHGIIDTVGRVWNSSNNQKTMFFGSTTNDRKQELMVESMIKYMIHIAEDYTGKSVDNILLITPINYTSDQNQVLERIISVNLRLNVLQMISEPLAACLAYEFDKPIKMEANSDQPEGKREIILVLDYGFQTSRASLVIRHSNTGLFTILHSETSDTVGGDQIDQCILEYVISEISKKYFNNRLSAEQKQIFSDPNSRVVRKLKQCIETAKNTLSTPSVNKTSISIESLLDGIDVSIDVLRARFDMAAEKVVNQAPVVIQKCLENAKKLKIPLSSSPTSDIDKVILVGGTSKVIKLKQVVLKQLGIAEDDKERCLDNVEYAPTVGGAIQSYLLHQESQQEKVTKKAKKPTKASNKKGGQAVPQQRKFDHPQVPCIPLSISLNTHGDGIVNIFPRFTSVPAEKEVIVSNAFDDQRFMLVRIVQGERLLASKNKEIGLYVLELKTQNEQKERGEIECKLLFSVDEEGELSVEVDEPDEDPEKPTEVTFVLHNVKENSQSVLESGDQMEEDTEENETGLVVFDQKKLVITEKEVEEMVRHAIAEHDADMVDFVNRDARSKLENYCYKCRKTLREQLASEPEKVQLVNEYLLQTLAWIQDNADLTKTQYLAKLHEFHAWYVLQTKK